jgi:hypothetical protein
LDTEQVLADPGGNLRHLPLALADRTEGQGLGLSPLASDRTASCSTHRHTTPGRAHGPWAMGHGPWCPWPAPNQTNRWLEGGTLDWYATTAVYLFVYAWHHPSCISSHGAPLPSPPRHMLRRGSLGDRDVRTLQRAGKLAGVPSCALGCQPVSSIGLQWVQPLRHGDPITHNKPTGELCTIGG